MRLLDSPWLFLGLLALPILVLYMLKLRRREIVVSSNLLWKTLLRDRQANAPWQKLKRNLLLILQLLILASLVIAMARPAVPTPSITTGSVTVILDGSASMNATDTTEGSRFETARKIAIEIGNDLVLGEAMTVILAGKQPEVLVARSQDTDLIRQALLDVKPTQGEADWPAAFSLAAGSSAGLVMAGGQPPSFVIISDGGLQEPGSTQNHIALPGETRYIPVGQDSENLAISVLAVRPGQNGPEMFAQVANYGSRAHEVLLSIFAEGALIHSELLQIEPGVKRSQSYMDLPASARIYEARISSDGEPLDAFSLDDKAYAIYQTPHTRRLLLASSNPNGNFFLESLLAAMPSIQPYRALRDEDGNLSLPNEPFDIYLFDGIFLEKEDGNLPEGAILAINPPENPLFHVTGVFSDTTNPRLTEDPLVRYVDWKNVHVRQARQIELPGWGIPLITAGGGPLVFAGEAGSRRVAAITFDLRDSDLPLQISFPILLSNLIEYLSPGGALQTPDSLLPGESLVIGSQRGASQIIVRRPNGENTSLAPGENGAAFLDTENLGLYTVNYLGEIEKLPDYFAVNLFSETESRIKTATSLSLGRTQVAASQQQAIGQRELWPWLAGIALLILSVEWWVYHQRSNISLPTLWRWKRRTS